MSFELLDGSFTTGGEALGFSNLPPKLTKLCLTGLDLSGPLDLTKIPRTLKYLDLSENQFDTDIITDYKCRWYTSVNLSANNIDEVDIVENCDEEGAAIQYTFRYPTEDMQPKKCLVDAYGGCIALINEEWIDMNEFAWFLEV